MDTKQQHAAFLAIICSIPSGWVMSYGAISRRAGLPRHARHVGKALQGLPADSTIPWWRVVNGEGRIAARGLDGHDDLQKVLLEAEGITFVNGRIDLRIFSWAGDERSSSFLREG